MKRYLALLFILSSVYLEGYSQSVTTDPPSFTPDDEVTITFDLSNSSLANYADDLYLWTWILNDDLTPKGPDAPTNVNPAGAGQEAAKLNRSSENPDIYTITFVPKDFFGVSSTEIPTIGVIAKGRDWGDGQTQNFYLDLLPPVFASPVVRIFPTQFTSEDIVTIFYDANLEEDAAMKAAGDYYLYVTIEGTDVNGGLLDPDDYLLPIDSNTKLTSIGNGRYRITFIPDRFFALNAGDSITKILYRVQNEDGSLTNPPAGFDVINVTVRKGVE